MGRTWRMVRAGWRALRRWARGVLEEADRWRAEHGDTTGWG